MGLGKKVDEDWPIVAKSLDAIQIVLLAWKGVIVNLMTHDHTLTRVKFHVATLFNTLYEDK